MPRSLQLVILQTPVFSFLPEKFFISPFSQFLLLLVYGSFCLVEKDLNQSKMNSSLLGLIYCVFLLPCINKSNKVVLSRSTDLVAQLCTTLCSFVHGDSPGSNTGTGCHALLQGIFTTLGSIPGLRRSPEGNGNPLQYSCLKNPTDRGAWQLQSMGLQRVRHD